MCELKRNAADMHQLTRDRIVKILPRGRDVAGPMAAIFAGARKRRARYDEAPFLQNLFQRPKTVKIHFWIWSNRQRHVTV